MIFTKKSKPETIAFTNTVEYLEVLLDPKLNWKQHVIDNRKKFCSSVLTCRRGTGKTWGFNSKLALWMYTAILLPKLLYVSSLVAHGKQGGGKEPAVKPTGQLPESCSGVHENDTHRQAGSSPVSDSSGSSHFEAARLTAYRLKCQGE
jgi:hypothetical protein